jgi:hypothetical protein
MSIPAINLDAIPDPATRAVIVQLLGIIEAQHAELVQLRAEVQQLRDENARLKGGSGKPDIRPPPTATPANRSSETERHTPTPHRKGRKAHQIIPTRTESCRIDPATLPLDAVRRDTTVTVVQDLRLVPDIVAFHRETWYSAAMGRTYTAPLPPGYHGAFGPHIRSLAVTLAHVTLVSEPQIHQLVTTAGIQVATGTIHAWVAHLPAALHAERDAVLHAGLASSPWQQIDDTPTRVNGRQHTCHVVGNPLYTAYRTGPSKNRLAVLTTLLNGQPLTFRLNADALRLLAHAGVSPALLTRLRAALPWDVPLTAGALATVLPTMGAQTRTRVCDHLAIAAYHAQTGEPIVQLLLCDDAPQFHQLVVDLALCWIHEGRHLAILTPIVPRHRHRLARVRRHFWTYYHALLAYRERPDPEERARLERSFTRLVTQQTGYPALDARLAILASKRDSLLVVLDHPEIPLHNNAMELGARRRVRKRDISFGPRSDAGVRAWDTCMTLVATAQKLGVNIIDYLHDRISGLMQLPALADLLTERARTANLGASWNPA